MLIKEIDGRATRREGGIGTWRSLAPLCFNDISSFQEGWLLCHAHCFGSWEVLEIEVKIEIGQDRDRDQDRDIRVVRPYVK